MIKSTLTGLQGGTGASLKDRIYEQLKAAIRAVDLYADDVDLRLDERELAKCLNTSRTPLREALTRLENEGVVRIVPRKGVYAERKSKDEIVEMIYAWAGLESMAARLVCERASDEEIAGLRAKLDGYGPEPTPEDVDAFDARDVDFHFSIIRLSGCAPMQKMADDLYAHIRSARTRIKHNSRRVRASVDEHEAIVEAIAMRDPALAESRVRAHAIGLAHHVRDRVNLPA